MPFTPFHFGPGLLLKSLVPRRFSWSTFVAAQVVIDCETLYYLAQGAQRVHRELHTFVGATLAGLATSCLILGFRRGLMRLFAGIGRWVARQKPLLRSELSTSAILLGGLIGGASHPLLDGLMHGDIRPFEPFSGANPLWHAIGVGSLRAFCVLSGMLGLLIVGIRLSEESVAVQPMSAGDEARGHSSEIKT